MGGYYFFILLNQFTFRSIACHWNICMELAESAIANLVNAALTLFTMPVFVPIKKTHHMSLWAMYITSGECIFQDQ